ncbi:SDR family NAD(P)-dependent oxidoreductase [Streptomyces sp. SLBN-31]|uniref:SDR family NAD(P)-dependent oxidoreductase n=1 Tax=Streptomyces sp. SLBN-31 TaxID=2768444 RepID=UPI001150D503|nr:SDR family NAD(P)-dependent oxidoreductase [Streptomyces sp. SLBN-31]TQJ92553.1 short subunit dehydrogenase [Streptomyces sp. SLBN-31]
MTALKGAKVFVTGGSRGIGTSLVEELYARGASRAYGTARDPRAVTHPHAVAVALEVTDPGSVSVAAAQAQDVTVLINNAGAAVGASFLDSPVDDVVELQPRGIAVTGLHLGYVDTDLAADVDAPKSDPRDVPALALDGGEAGAYEVLAADISRQVKAGLADDLAGLYAQLSK